MDVVHAIYEKEIKPLAIPKRMQLVQLIMNDLAQMTSRWVVEESDSWSDEDLQDLAQASLIHATQTVLEDDDEEI